VKTTTASIQNLVDRVNRGEIRLPEIQRAYVWKAAQVAGLFDSLYKGYPSGSLLLWETEERVTERRAALDGPQNEPLVRPQYLLDGQQRLTSLHRVFIGHRDAQLRFNVVTERFQMASATTEKDPRWVNLTDLFTGAAKPFALVKELTERYTILDPEVTNERLERLKKIADYPYYVEIIDGLPYNEVTDIFVRVNSKGRALKATDLALATLSARWPGVVAKLDAEAQHYADQGFRTLDVAFLVRLLAALATPQGGISGLGQVDTDELESAWGLARKGLAHTINLLRQNAGIRTSSLITSTNALIPIATFLGIRDNEALGAEDAKGLVYWMFGANLALRYSAGKETRLAEDLATVRAGGAVRGLLRSLGLFDHRLEVRPAAIAGRGVASPFFPLSYLVADAHGAKDWFFGLDIGTDLRGEFRLEYHHIHPQATVRARFTKAEINDLANLAFISGRANRKIGKREPSLYLAEVDDGQRAAHLIPSEEYLWLTVNYRGFLRSRRELLADAMTELLDSFRPDFLDDDASPRSDVSIDLGLDLTTYGTAPDGSDSIVVFTAHHLDATSSLAVAGPDLHRLVADLGDGLSAGFQIGSQWISVDPGDETIEVPIGPLEVIGTIDEWVQVITRELGDERLPLTDVPELSADAWTGDREQFPVVDASGLPSNADEAADPARDAPASTPESSTSEPMVHLIETGVLNVGEELVWNRPQAGTTFRLVLQADGSLLSDDGQRFWSPSAAATRLSGTSTNGWKAWRVPRIGDALLDDLR